MLYEIIGVMILIILTISFWDLWMSIIKILFIVLICILLIVIIWVKIDTNIKKADIQDSIDKKAKNVDQKLKFNECMIYNDNGYYKNIYKDKTKGVENAPIDLSQFEINSSTKASNK